MADPDISFKLLLLGDSGVGKSSILLRFTEDTFETEMGPTIGVDFRVKHMNVDGKTVKLMVWDTAGSERFRTLTSSYYRGAHGVIFVYDVTDRNSFERLSMWQEEVEAHKSFPVVMKLLVGNKLDLVQSGASDRMVPVSLAEDFARQNGMMWIEVSAKTKEGIQEAFSEMVNKILDTESLVRVAQSTKKSGVMLGGSRPDRQSGGSTGLCC
ncbi:GTP-binding protein yptV3 [Diplonema papillatum]|nr:GTP-binding protein yptV3 [Diplonema papillatum]